MIAPAQQISTQLFSQAEVKQFERDGYIIVRGMAAHSLCGDMLEIARAALAQKIAPMEYEADVHYPGAPSTREAPGGDTARRLLQAYARHPLFAQWATAPQVTQRLQQLLGTRLVLAQAHHNCIMTKQPAYSSVTGWHQDFRYWSFEKAQLVNVWLALGHESAENGCLKILPGSHRMQFARERLDDTLFLRSDLPENQALIATQVLAQLEPGDTLFFHCLTLHAAGCNRTDQTKFSLVYTYHTDDNHPLDGTRSAQVPEITI